MWWTNKEDSIAGVKERGSSELVGLKLKSMGKSTRFSIVTEASQGVVYNFDLATGTRQKPKEHWIEALKQHAAFAERMHSVRAQ